MAINYWEMFATLKIGVDVETLTPTDQVPHAYNPGYTPVYTVRNNAGHIVSMGVDVHEMVEWAHGELEALTLYEDEYPVFTVY